MSGIEFTSRYDVLGPPNGCDGDCEGTGWIPVRESDTDPTLAALWQAAHAKPHGEPCDGWHFVPCPKCHPAPPSTAATPEQFVCPTCGPGVAADEDGCCVTCGADCEIKSAATPEQP